MSFREEGTKTSFGKVLASAPLLIVSCAFCHLQEKLFLQDFWEQMRCAKRSL